MSERTSPAELIFRRPRYSNGSVLSLYFDHYRGCKVFLPVTSGYHSFSLNFAIFMQGNWSTPRKQRDSARSTVDILFVGMLMHTYITKWRSRLQLYLVQARPLLETAGIFFGICAWLYAFRDLICVWWCGCVLVTCTDVLCHVNWSSARCFPL